LIIVAHPQLAGSRINAALLHGLRSTNAAVIHDIYTAYPDGVIDVAYEQRLVDAHDRVIFQFPLYWYSCPPFLSTWLVEVYKRGWAYGPGGRALNFKTLGVAITTGSNGRDYTLQGRYHRSLDDVLVPFELLARHSGMHYLPAFAVSGAREVTDDELALVATNYREHVVAATPHIVFDGSDDSRAKTVYPAHYHTQPTGEKRHG
jgi:NAD(P)H dehydrogenase (quinone)